MTPMQERVEIQKELDAKNKKLKEILDEAGPDYNYEAIKSIPGTTSDKRTKIIEMNNEFTELGKKLDEAVQIELAAKASKEFENRAPASGGFQLPVAAPKEQKSLGQLFTESDVFKNKRKETPAQLDIDMKTVFSRSAGWAPESLRSGRMVDYATRPIQVIDLIPMGTINQAVYKYMEETTFTNAAAERAESTGAYAESALALTERSATVETIGTSLPVTDEQLEDVDGIQSYLDQRLDFMIRQRLDYQLLQGDGATPNILGLYNKGSIQTQAKGADPTPDAFYKAMTKVRVTGQSNPNAIIMHPNDWQDVRLLRTADGIYIWGNPSEAGPERMWGLNVAAVQAATENTGIVGDFAGFSMFFIKKGVTVEITNTHSTDFVYGKQMLRAGMRGVAVWFRPVAFCTVTGI